MIVIKLAIFYFVMGLLIWISFPCMELPPRRPKFWKFFCLGTFFIFPPNKSMDLEKINKRMRGD